MKSCPELPKPKRKKLYKFVLRTLAGLEDFEQEGVDSTEAGNLLAEKLDMTPAGLLSITEKVYENGRLIWQEHER